MLVMPSASIAWLSPGAQLTPCRRSPGQSDIGEAAFKPYFELHRPLTLLPGGMKPLSPRTGIGGTHLHERRWPALIVAASVSLAFVDDGQ
jgi:hypothetical protein